MWSRPGRPARDSSISIVTPRVALVLATVQDLSGSGGTERQFSDLFDYLCEHRPESVQLVTARVAVRRLREAGRLRADARVIALPLGERPGQTKAGIVWMTFALLWSTVLHRWDVVHLCQPTPSYVPFAAILSWLPRSIRPRIALTVVDCTLAPNLASAVPPVDRYEQQVLDAHAMYFRWVRLDGMFTWYKAFAAQVARLRLAPGARVTAARYCFTDPIRFMPADKERVILYAGRMSVQKRPMLFVDAVASLRLRHAQLADGWRFAMYGAGPLEAQVQERIGALGLQHLVTVSRTPDMAPVFARSSLFVSTQAHENFTSLAMLEAMSAGNAVIAERVGQTDWFVRDGENGLLVDGATPEAFADAMAQYLAAPARHAAMAEASRRIVVEEHNIEHFAGDIGAFWETLART